MEKQEEGQVVARGSPLNYEVSGHTDKRFVGDFDTANIYNGTGGLDTSIDSRLPIAPTKVPSYPILCTSSASSSVTWSLVHCPPFSLQELTEGLDQQPCINLD